MRAIVSVTRVGIYLQVKPDRHAGLPDIRLRTSPLISISLAIPEAVDMVL